MAKAYAAICLRDCYAMSGTDISNAAICLRDVQCDHSTYARAVFGTGTELGYVQYKMVRGTATT
eukprot:204298-Rhodomonas_salina.1